jgi:hypothetical protein
MVEIEGKGDYDYGSGKHPAGYPGKKAEWLSFSREEKLGA